MDPKETRHPNKTPKKPYSIIYKKSLKIIKQLKALYFVSAPARGT